MKYIYIVLLFFVFTLSACKWESETSYVLTQSNKELKFKLDNNIKSSIQVLFLYKDKDGKEYLTFQNQDLNEIYFYNLETRAFDFKITPPVEGSNGVGLFYGYYIHNLDSIFLTTNGLQEISLINKEGVVVDKFEYFKTEDGVVLNPFSSITFVFQPIIVEDNKLYILSKCNRWNKKNPVSATLNLLNKQIDKLEFEYPKFPDADNKAKAFGIEAYFSRIINDQSLIYSFFYDENIYISSLTKDQIRKVKIKSKYIDKIPLPNDYDSGTSLNTALRLWCESPNYGNLYYDKYRKVYYRIAYPQTEIDKKENSMDIWLYGRKEFSIIILDEDFNIIGETLLPEYRFNSTLLFIREDGLYISNNHPINPGYNDDILSFVRFDLLEE